MKSSLPTPGGRAKAKEAERRATQRTVRLSRVERTVDYLAGAGAAGVAGAAGAFAAGAAGAAGVVVEAVAGAVGAAGVAAAALAGAAGVVGAAAVVAGVRAEFVLLARPTKPRYKPKLRMKSSTVRVVVIRERTLADSPPKTDSAAPPPRAEPMPAFALGRCIRMIRTTKRQTRKRMKTEA